jgi:hypothetical protein
MPAAVMSQAGGFPRAEAAQGEWASWRNHPTAKIAGLESRGQAVFSGLRSMALHFTFVQDTLLVEQHRVDSPSLGDRESNQLGIPSYVNRLVVLLYMILVVPSTRCLGVDTSICAAWFRTSLAWLPVLITKWRSTCTGTCKRQCGKLINLSCSLLNCLHCPFWFEQMIKSGFVVLFPLCIYIYTYIYMWSQL